MITQKQTLKSVMVKPKVISNIKRAAVLLDLINVNEGRIRYQDVVEIAMIRLLNDLDDENKMSQDERC